MKKLFHPLNRKTDYRPALWGIFWVCSIMYLFGCLMSKPDPVVYDPYIIQLEGSANDTNN